MSLNTCIQVPGADPSNPGTQERIAVAFEAGSLPKLQSFKSAVHSNGKYRLLVGGRCMCSYCTIGMYWLFTCHILSFVQTCRSAPIWWYRVHQSIGESCLVCLGHDKLHNNCCCPSWAVLQHSWSHECPELSTEAQWKKLPFYCWRVWLLSECKDHDNPEYCKLLCIRSLIVGRS